MNPNYRLIFLRTCFTVNFFVIGFFLSYGTEPFIPKADPLDACRAVLERDTLTLENKWISRTFKWNRGNLIGLQIRNEKTGQVWKLNNGAVPDFRFPGIPVAVLRSEFRVERVRKTSTACEHLRAEVWVHHGALEIKRVFRLYPNCPAIASDYYFKAASDSLPSAAVPGVDTVSVMERLCLPGNHWKLKAIEFFDRTDQCNTLVEETSILAFRRPFLLRGNVLYAKDMVSDQGIFILKEAPCSSVQLHYPGYDFSCRIGEIQIVGIGVTPNDFNSKEWIRSYGNVTGICGGTESDFLHSLRMYQENIRTHLPDRDEMIMMNTWGDRNRDANIGTEFILREIDACKNLGISHFQIDDGWQTGLSKNSAKKEGQLWDEWSTNDWLPNPQRFPKGLKPVADYAKKQGVEIGLWFHPSSAKNYEKWEQDADVVIRLFKTYGIRYFKIDGVKLPDKSSDARLRQFFEKVISATQGQVVFNLDATADNRGGYHYFNEYGNIFLENRYTDWINYYPYWTLRNLWMLSRYVPPQNLQIEFLNKWRQADLYPSDDPFSPSKIPFDYSFAVTLMAQPLAWFEGTGLPAEAMDTAPMIRQYRKLQKDIHAGRVFPIGEEPSGKGWTGFQSIHDSTGYILVFREFNPNSSRVMNTWLIPDKPVRFEKIFGFGDNFTATSGENGAISFSLPKPNGFCLYRYHFIDTNK